MYVTRENKRSNGVHHCIVTSVTGDNLANGVHHCIVMYVTGDNKLANGVHHCIMHGIYQSIFPLKISVFKVHASISLFHHAF
jgi:hypothetical protein